MPSGFQELLPVIFIQGHITCFSEAIPVVSEVCFIVIPAELENSTFRLNVSFVVLANNLRLEFSWIAYYQLFSFCHKSLPC